MIVNGYEIFPNADVPADEYHVRNAAGAVLDVAEGMAAAKAKAAAMAPGDIAGGTPKPEPPIELEPMPALELKPKARRAGRK